MSPWQPTVVGLAVGMYVIVAEAIRFCPEILLGKHILFVVDIDVAVDVGTWSF